MNTILLYPDFVKNAESLDYQRLHKQLKDCVTLSNTIILGESNNRTKITRMWYGYNEFYMSYFNAIFDECRKRKIKGHIYYEDKVIECNKYLNDTILYPEWYTSEKLYKLNRQNVFVESLFSFLVKEYSWLNRISINDVLNNNWFDLNEYYLNKKYIPNYYIELLLDPYKKTFKFKNPDKITDSKDLLRTMSTYKHYKALFENENLYEKII